MGCGASQAESMVNANAITKADKQKPVLPKIETRPTTKTPKAETMMSVRSITSTDNQQNTSMTISQNVDACSIERIKTPTKFIRSNLNEKTVLKPIPYNKPRVHQTINFNDDLGEEQNGESNDEEFAVDDGKPNRPFDLENASLGSGSHDASQDSGFSDNELKNIITEKSNPELVQQIEKEFRERENLDLMVTGKACPVILTVKEKKDLQHLEEMKSLQLLEDSGLVQQEIVRKENCVKFEITAQSASQAQGIGNLAPLKRIPPQFLKEPEKTPSSQDKIYKKLEEAQKRKERQTQQKINQLRIHNAEHDKNNDDDDDADDFNENDEDFDENYRPRSVKKFDPEVYARQKKLLEIRDKIRAINSDSTTPRNTTPVGLTPRTQELLNELDKFRPKTSSNFKPVFD